MNTFAFAFRTILVAACVVFVSLGFDTSAEQPLRIEQNGAAHELHWESENGTTSFLQHSPDLSNWQYTLHYHVGDGSARTQTLDEDLRPEGEGPDFYRLLLHPTNPEDPDDTDGDGLPNIFELGHGYVPVLTDSDGNGTPDGDEDLDDDGDSNVTEISNGTDADDSSSNSGEDLDEADIDKDGIIDSEDGWPLCKELAPERLSKPKYAVICVKELESNENITLYEINNNAHALITTYKPSNQSRPSYYYKADAADNPLIDLPSSYIDLWGNTAYHKYTALNEANYFVQAAGEIYQSGVLKADLKPHDLPYDDNLYWGARPSTQVDCVDPDGASYGRGFSSKYADPEFEWRTLTGPTSYTSAVRWDANGGVSLHGDLAVEKGGSYNKFSWGFDSGVEFLGNYKIDHVLAINSLGIRMIDRQKINKFGYSYGFNRYYGDLRHDLEVWRNGTYQSLLTDYAILNNEYYNYENTEDELEAFHLSNKNTVMAGQGSETLIWLDQTAGLQNDQPVTATPKLKKITWLDTWGPAPPINLNARMQGFESNGSKIWHNSLWLDITDIIPATEWTDIQIKDINDHGMLAAQATDAAGTKCAVFLVPVDIVPDYNRDGKIDQADRGKVTKENPWRWWINDDDDDGVIEGDDIPNGNGVGLHSPDKAGSTVDGIRDLVDFFPLYFDLKEVLKVLPESDYQYFFKFKEHAGSLPNIQVSPFQVVWYPEADLDAEPTQDEGVGAFLYNLDRAADIAARRSHSPLGGEIRIPDEMLAAAKMGKGVALFEGYCETDSHIGLEVRKNDGTKIMMLEFPVKISGVEDMFAHLNFRADQGGGTQRTGPPANKPYNSCNKNWFVFVHGYNVNGEQARGWSSEFFKRLHWSGSNARFYAISWHGDEGQIKLAGVTPNYQQNVNNAFGSAELVGKVIDGLAEAGGEVTVAAHSLGNMVVGSAIHDWDARPARYFMIDSAVPKEAYDFDSNEPDDTNEYDDSAQDARMTNPYWVNYSKELRCSEWHNLGWLNGDKRKRLTWKRRLGNVLTSGVAVYNFHSTGEEVLQNPEAGDPAGLGTILWATPTKIWAVQEKKKGHGITGHVHTSDYGGWAFNMDAHNKSIQKTVGPYGDWVMKEPAEMKPVSAAMKKALKTLSFFDDAEHGALFSFSEGEGTPGSNYAENNRNTLLCEMIPATTLAAGANPLKNLEAGTTTQFSKNYDMESLFKTDVNEWPYENSEYQRRWKHSDIREVAYSHNYKVYLKFVDEASLGESAGK